MQLIELVALTAKEIVEVSGNPESSENRASIVAVRVCRYDGRELMRRGRCLRMEREIRECGRTARLTVALNAGL